MPGYQGCVNCSSLVPCRKPPLPSQVSLRAAQKRPSLAPADGHPADVKAASSAAAASSESAAAHAADPTERKAPDGGAPVPRPRYYARRTQPTSAPAASTAVRAQGSTTAAAHAARVMAPVQARGGTAARNPMDTSSIPQVQRRSTDCTAEQSAEELSSMLAGLSTSSASFSFSAARNHEGSDSMIGVHLGKA